MSIRLNVTLPEATVALIDRAAENGNRSRLIDQAVQGYVRQPERARLRERLKQGALARAERDLALAREWFTVEEETWPQEQ
jgi:CopG family transcriptional regulator/antitoxin EndoAI